MDKEVLLEKALEAKTLYNMGEITRAEAKALIEPYAKYYNEKNIEIAKKYNRKPVKFSFNSFVR